MRDRSAELLLFLEKQGMNSFRLLTPLVVAGTGLLVSSCTLLAPLTDNSESEIQKELAEDYRRAAQEAKLNLEANNSHKHPKPESDDDLGAALEKARYDPSIPAHRIVIEAPSYQRPPPVPEVPVASAQPRRTSPSTRIVYIGENDGHWIESVMDDGSVIKLEDGSLWQISQLDQIDSALWLPVSDVTVIEGNDPFFPYKLVNTDDNETVNARLIHR